jgi:hypothetical protein
MLCNRCVLQQQHVDCKIADALLKKGSKQYADGWDVSSKDWAHMVLHLPHAEGGFSVPFNCVTKDAAFYTTTSRFVSWIGAFPQERQELWLPKDDLRDSSSWSSPPLVLLRNIHSKLLTQFDCKEVCASSPSQVNAGAGARPSSQDGVSQQQETASLSLPQLNRLVEASFVQPFRDLKLMFAASLRAEQLSLRSQQRVVATVEESVLKTEMADLESQEEDTPKSVSSSSSQ